MFGKILKRNSKHKLFVQNFFFSKIIPFLDNVKKYCRAVQATDNNKTWRMHVACLIPKAIGTHSKHVICFSTTNLVAQTLLNISLYVHYLCLNFSVKVNVKVSPCSRPHGSRGGVEVHLYSFMTSALDGGGWYSSLPGRLYPRKKTGTHCTGGWVGPRAGLERCGKSRSQRYSIPGPSSP